MKLKLDENVHGDVALAVRAESRCLVTSDLDFADPRHCPPSQFAGLVVLRLGAPTTRNQIACLTRFFAGTTDIARRPWILEDTRARDWTP